ncbi:MAG TPA: VOC family protein [Candidatus Binatia bacterium]|jgi:catechol 2,3-dioxygenase-like lactoylglutathione lyase family enzyme|nr:VOC family protein [Candidatus Binatia bacterium]
MRRLLLASLGAVLIFSSAPAEENAPAFHIKNVHHILLTVKDLDTSVHFYHDVLGLTLDQQYKTFAMLRAGEFGIYLSTRPWPFDKQSAEKGAGIFPHFEVDNMDALVTRLKSSGTTVLQEPKSYSWGKECFALDPDGYQWSFVELAPQRR